MGASQRECYIRHFRTLASVDGAMDESDDPAFVHVLLERCSRCRELAPTATSVGTTPVVKVRWRFRKSGSCDHLVVDYLEVTMMENAKR